MIAGRKPILNLKFDPYRAMFPIGLFLGIWGVGSWLIYGFNLTQNYPGTYHSTLMIGGFLFLIATGFLMTAIPAFTETEVATPVELGISIFFALALAIAGIANDSILFHRLFLAQMVALLSFGVRRVLKRKNNPPPPFIFIALGILCRFFGDVIMCIEDKRALSEGWYILGHNLFFQGMMLSFVLGVGSRLLPALMGWEELPLEESITPASLKPSLQNFQMPFLILVMFLLAASFFIEAFIDFKFGRILRALCASVIAFRFWKLHKFPLEKTWLSRWLWVSGWCVVIGLWGYATFPSYAVDLLHITFVGGFSLMTLMIATRVTLAHGDHGYDLEGTSKALKWAGVLILAAMLTRVLAPFTMDRYRTHLGYASLAWTMAIIIWACVFLKKIFLLSNSDPN